VLLLCIDDTGILVDIISGIIKLREGDLIN
jgi:hypothetical protein